MCSGTCHNVMRAELLDFALVRAVGTLEQQNFHLETNMHGRLPPLPSTLCVLLFLLSGAPFMSTDEQGTPQSEKAASSG